MHQIVQDKTHSEQFTADMLRTLYRAGYIDFPTLDRMIDELQVRLFRREMEEKDNNPRHRRDP